MTVAARVEYRAVVDHEPFVVEERPVARLPGGEADGVVAEHVLRCTKRVGSPEVPLVEGRDVPDGDVVTNRRVLLLDVAEPLGPHPSAVLHVASALRSDDVVERALDRLLFAHRTLRGVGGPSLRSAQRFASRAVLP
jgi:hypothetical protein